MAIIIGGNLDINGTSGSGCVWTNVDITSIGGTATADYCTVSGSTNSDETSVTCTNCIDSGGNTGWNFGTAAGNITAPYFTSISNLYGPTSVSVYEDYFIDADGKSLDAHPATHPHNIHTVLPATTTGWTIVTGEGEIENNLSAIVTSTLSDQLGDMPQFGVARTVGTFLSVLVDSSDSYSCRMRVEATSGTGVSGLVFAYADADNYLKLDVDSSTGKVLLQARDNASFSNVNTFITDTGTLSRPHTFEAHVDGDDFYVYADNVRWPTSGTVSLATYLTTDATGNQSGYRSTSSTGVCRYFSRGPLKAYDRVYYSQSTGNDTTPGDGSYANPYKTLSKLETEITAQGSQTIHCLLAGDTWSGADLDFVNVSGVDDYRIEQYGHTGAKPLMDYWRTITGWSTTATSEVYVHTGDGDERALLMEDGVRLDGSGVNNRIVTNSGTTGYEQPAVADLPRGSWRCEADNSDVYVRCSDGASPTTHTIKIATSNNTSGFLDIRYSDDVIVWDMDVTGVTSGQGQIAHRYDCSRGRIEFCEFAHGYQGATYGGQNASNPEGKYHRIYNCDAVGMQWRGHGAQNPDLTTSLFAPSMVANRIGNNFKFGYLNSDEEALMVTHGDGGDGTDPTDRAIVALNYCHNNGDSMGDLYYDNDLTLKHPGPIVCDSANAMVFNNIVSRGYMTAFVVNALAQDITHYACVNNLVLNFDAANMDGGDAGRHCMVFGRVLTGFDLTGINIGWNTVLDGDWQYTAARADIDGAITITCNNAAVDISGDIKYNLFESTDADILVNINDDGASPTWNLDIDYNLWHLDDTTAGTTRAYYFGTGITYSDFSTSGWGDSYDVNSTFASADLTNLVPSATSDAVGLGSDTAHPFGFDFYLQPRLYDTAGAIETDGAGLTVAPYLDSTPVFYEPTMESPAGAQDLTAPLLDSTPVFYDISLGAGAATVTSPILQSTPVFYDLTLPGGVPVLSDLAATSITATSVVPRVDYTIPDG